MFSRNALRVEQIYTAEKHFITSTLTLLSSLQEMQKAFNSYKCLMISVNLSSHHFLRGDSAELRELQEALVSANHSWTQACGGLESWERRLHCALMQCQVRRRDDHCRVHDVMIDTSSTSDL